MKKIIIVVLSGLILLHSSSCSYEYVDSDWLDTDDTLKISAFLFNEDNGDDYFILEEWGYEYNRKEGAYNKDNDGNYVPERLQLNEVRLMYPMAPVELAASMINLNMFLEFNGEVEVISENNDIWFGFDRCHSNVPFLAGSGCTGQYGFQMRVPSDEYDGVYINFLPLGSNAGYVTMREFYIQKHYVGKTYYITVNRYISATSGVPVATARLKLIQLEDKFFAQDILDGSGTFSIELISYESDFDAPHG